MTLKQAAQSAMAVQDACNLSGVVREFKFILHEVLWPASHEKERGTSWVNQHPISKLFADKIASLAGVQGHQCFEQYHKAWEECGKLATGEGA